MKLEVEREKRVRLPAVRVWSGLTRSQIGSLSEFWAEDLTCRRGNKRKVLACLLRILSFQRFATGTTLVSPSSPSRINSAVYIKIIWPKELPHEPLFPTQFPFVSPIQPFPIRPHFHIPLERFLPKQPNTSNLHQSVQDSFEYQPSSSGRTRSRC